MPAAAGTQRFRNAGRKRAGSINVNLLLGRRPRVILRPLGHSVKLVFVRFRNWNDAFKGGPQKAARNRNIAIKRKYFRLLARGFNFRRHESPAFRQHLVKVNNIINIDSALAQVDVENLAAFGPSRRQNGKYFIQPPLPQEFRRKVFRPVGGENPEQTGLVSDMWVSREPSRREDTPESPLAPEDKPALSTSSTQTMQGAIASNSFNMVRVRASV